MLDEFCVIVRNLIMKEGWKLRAAKEGKRKRRINRRYSCFLNYICRQRNRERIVSNLVNDLFKDKKYESPENVAIQ
jgi:hypothetical protein